MSEVVHNPYLDSVKVALPRLLSLFDQDKSSISYGFGDRFHWSWGLIDFPNGTFQGAAHGLARLWVSGLWPYKTKADFFIERIDSMFQATGGMTRSDGSLEEAFPNEGSYCVTALVAYDLLCAADLLKNTVDVDTFQSWIEIIRPLISFIVKHDEKHAFISNHLATALAALVRWNKISADQKSIAKALDLKRSLINAQSSDGWFPEYDGADPGYQSLCLYYLADVYGQQPDNDLFNALKRSIEFLWYFAHPDGSFGGLYGSRCTRFYFPSGILALAKQIPESKALSSFMQNSISLKKVVTLDCIDEPSLIPMFNSYVQAAETFSKNANIEEELVPPALLEKSFTKLFPSSGLFIDSGISHYTIIGLKKGGVVYHFINNKLNILDAGVVVKNKKGRLGSSQNLSDYEINHESPNEIKISGPIVAMPKNTPSPIQFLILRIMSITFFHSSYIRELVKRFLVKFLITRKSIWPCSNQRIIILGKKLIIDDKTNLSPGFKIMTDFNYFVPIHMASKGYWQIQDENTQ